MRTGTYPNGLRKDHVRVLATAGTLGALLLFGTACGSSTKIRGGPGRLLARIGHLDE
jgi:hypothetical protein